MTELSPAASPATHFPIPLLHKLAEGAPDSQLFYLQLEVVAEPEKWLGAQPILWLWDHGKGHGACPAPEPAERGLRALGVKNDGSLVPRVGSNQALQHWCVKPSLLPC